MQSDLVKGAAFILLSELFFVLMGTQVREVSTQLSNEMIVFFRNLIGLQIIVPLVMRNGWSSLKSSTPQLHLLRGLAGVSAMYCFFYAIANLPLANAMILKMSAPLFIPLIAFIWLKEPPSWMIGLVVILGFAGVILIIKPDFDALDRVAMIALAGGFFAAVAKSTVKRLTNTDKPATVVFYFALTALTVSSLPAFLHWQTPNSAQLAQLILLGVLASGGQFFMTRAYSYAPASQISHYSYSSILYASAFGWLLWDEWMDSWAWFGAGMVVISGVLLIRRKKLVS
ncbi:MAG: DMT family transporter [Gammaproteobacteria bacterium]|nr:DMT family transporter [Gammaproteobacteria bacterium]MBL7000012.1 DMT family transporter [Gammaproteobacteria bacterium]